MWYVNEIFQESLEKPQILHYNNVGNFCQICA